MMRADEDCENFKLTQEQEKMLLHHGGCLASLFRVQKRTMTYNRFETIEFEYRGVGVGVRIYKRLKFNEYSLWG